MMRNENGINLIVMVIMIMTLIIIAAVSITFGMEIVKEIENRRTMTELSSIQQAIFEQYALLRSYGSEGQFQTVSVTEDIILEKDNERPLELIGTRIVNPATLEEYGFITYKVTYTTEMPFERYYYLLTKSDLKILGVSDKNAKDKDYSYIVNYSTGEVFDLVHTIYIDKYDSELIDAKLDGTTNILDKTEYDFTE